MRANEKGKKKENIASDVEKKEENETAKETENLESEKVEPEKVEPNSEEQISVLTDKLMRTVAEFDNFKKRTVREKQDFFKMAVCDTVETLIPVLDNLDRAIIAGEENDDKEALLDGVKMIQKQFVEALSNIGVEQIPAIGEEFDPEKHNAVMVEESDKPENIIIDELM
ncbi:MAG: nucleotide exchange factor GrpE, partial [Oscillospiraceae bacterium]